MNKKTIKVFINTEDECMMISAIKEMNIPGWYWPNMDDPEFDLDITDEELLILRLRIPFTIKSGK